MSVADHGKLWCGALLGSAGVAIVRAVGGTIGGSVPLGSAEVVAPIVRLCFCFLFTNM